MALARKTFIDDPDYLRRWFREKGHHYLVFRVADAMDLLASDQRALIRLLQAFEPDQVQTPPPDRDDDLVPYMKRLGRLGYFRVSADAICRRFDIDQLRDLQGTVSAYRDIRQSKMYPNKTSDCTNCTEGTRKRCTHCAGTGQVQVLLELDEAETVLATGADWDEIA